MILIISNQIDQSTHEVLEWMISQTSEKVIIFNEYNSIKEIKIALQNDSREELIFQTTTGESFNLADINYVWYRRGPLFIDMNSNLIGQEQINNSLRKDWIIVSDFILDRLKEKKFFAHP